MRWYANCDLRPDEYLVFCLDLLVNPAITLLLMKQIVDADFQHD